MDKHSLADSVNAEKIDIIFRVTPFVRFSDGLDWLSPDDLVIQVTADDLDPGGRPVGERCIELSKDQFIHHQIASVGKEVIKVRDVIRWAAHVAGGVHYDPRPAKEYDTINIVSQQLTLGELPYGVYQLRAIGRITERALEPLVKSLRRR